MNFQNMTLSDLENEKIRLTSEINQIDAQTRRQNGELPRLLREQIHELIERLIAKLLPNLFLPTLAELKKTFPDEPQLTGVEPETLLPRDNSLWGKIKRMFGITGAPSQNLERQRILLRNILWNLSKSPTNNGSNQYLFSLLLTKKKELTAAEQDTDQVDLNEEEMLLSRQSLTELLRECKAEIVRRKWKPQKDDYHKRHEQEVYDRRTSVDPVIYPSEPYSSTENYSSGSDSTDSTDSDFSYGGGGDFAGGGAGGSWDNYS